MARFTLVADQATILRIVATGCDALHVTVTGHGPTGAILLLSHSIQSEGSPYLSLSYQFAAREIEPFQTLHIDPVLYGQEGQSYQLEIGLRNGSDKDWSFTETTKGSLERSRVSARRSITGTDAPLFVVDLEVHDAFLTENLTATAADMASMDPVAGDHPDELGDLEPAASDDLDVLGDFEPASDDEIDLSDDFSLRVPPPASAPPPPPPGAGAGSRAAAHSSSIPTDWDRAGYGQPSDDGAKLYPVWYGTNRMPAMENGRLVGYSAFRDKEVHYGRCAVRIPRSHKIGSTGSPFWKRIVTLTDDRLKLTEVLRLERAAFWSGVAEQLRAANRDARHVVVFLHGYNVSFEEAAIRAAQLGCDLSIEGAMAFYSWPSRGTVEGYFADESTVQASGKYVTRFLQDVAELAEAKKVHVIAHSMGNRAALEAVREIVARAQAQTRVPFSQFILAAPDVDAEYFLQFADTYRTVASRTTMYVSDRDHAVRASRFLHGGEPRVGLAPPIQIVSGIDTVYAGKVDQSLLGHGYVATAWQLLNDMHQMIHLDAEAHKRSWVTRAHSEDHWLLKGVT